MFGRIRFYDYRCFWREEPATLELSSGFTSFIGPNNAGKSTLIKSVYELRSVISRLPSLKSSFGNPPTQFEGWNPLPPLHDRAEIVTDRDHPACAIELEPSVPPQDRANSGIKLRVEFDNQGGQFACRLLTPDGREIGLSTISTSVTVRYEDRIGIATGETFFFKPLLDFIQSLTDSQYFGPFRNAINSGGGNHFDTQIGTAFIGQWHEWKTGASKQRNRAVGRVTEDVRRLLGAKTLEITASNELQTLQVVVDGRHHKLSELGSGFSQLVLVLGNALIRPPSFILIDEPELHLHPALQGDFLTTIASYASRGVLYTTHSMGLARLADACYTVQRRNSRSIVRPFARTPHYAEFLGSLGIAGLQDIGWNRILLVEGPKDVRTLQQLLRQYDKDRHTIVIPLGGDSLVNGVSTHELSEVRRLCDHVFAVIDSERPAESAEPMKARKQFAETCVKLGIKCCVTERRAIENYISQQALDEAFTSGRFTALPPYELPPKDGAFWGKGESWKAAAKMTREEIDATDIGKFLAAL